MAPSVPALPAVTLVIPIFNEEAVLPELLARLTAVFDAHPVVEWDALLVDDGSRDRSAELVRAQAGRDPRFALLELSRNFGFQAALAAGLAHAKGAAVVTMDADLQDPPECIPELVARWREGAEVVRAVRRSRQETGSRRLGMDAFHRLFNRISDYPIEANTGTFGLLDRQAVDAMNRLPERHRFFPGMRSWVGFATAEIHYDRQERAAGQPQQTLRRLARYAFDGVFSFSYLPLRLMTYTGLAVGTAGFLLGLYYVIKRVINIETAPTGFTTLAALVLFLGGIQLIGIGVLGEYLARVYDEVKERPLYLVKRGPTR
ncbi:MAG TPA: glycosyltransferase family 2 protein [Lacunisphaera sp.]|jgi:glycosyltransferase involved in cell wall biosynthesis|nr:glycosyltransferase family 2 protein [Lacunisphaera sp.]HQY05258.1 glycosyltransferase family 2 protein [Lacunisphaera sp.]